MLRAAGWIALGMFFLGSLDAAAHAQTTTGPRSGTRQPPRTVTGGGAAAPRVSRTTVSIELIVGNEGIGLAAQEWSQSFEQLNMPVRIRSQLLEEKPEVKEKMLGTLRQVTVVGRLDKSGRIVFPERSFSRSEIGKLKDWITELETFGAQGAPNGKPLWGLSEAQFATVYGALGKKLDADVDGLPLAQAIAKVELPESLALRFSAAAIEWLRTEFPEAPAVRNPVKGMAIGTALAIITNEVGLGFHPQRMPDGKLELLIDPLKTNPDAWPIGWEPKLSRQKTAPKLFELIPVELDNVPLLDVFEAITAKTGVPIHIDHYRIEAKGIVLADLAVSYPQRQTSWSLLLKGVTNPAKMTRRLQIDELGQPFLWVTTLEPGRRDD